MGGRGPRIAWLVGAALVVPTAARARDLDYQATEGCPSRDEVEASLRARASGVESRASRIDVRRDGDAYRGEVTLGEGDAKITREVSGRTCGAVVDALALVAAIDANANADASAGAEVDADANGANDRAGDTPSAPASENVDADRGAAPRANGDVEIGLGVSAFGLSFAKGEVLVGGAPYGEIALGDAFGVSWMQPSMRLSGAFTGEATTSASLSTRFKLTSGILEVCPVGAHVGAESIRLAACARGEIGSLTARAGAPEDGFERSRLWGTAGGSARLRYLFADTSSAVRPAIEAGGGVVATMVRDRFYAGTESAVRAPTWLWTASVGFGVVIP
ncbi:MAG: hypothetical protein KF819_07180 [Labilithrix sp.]|nr:hypothetical protein [Labilithrix sp.]